jgi:hypothetical protein
MERYPVARITEHPGHTQAILSQLRGAPCIQRRTCNQILTRGSSDSLMAAVASKGGSAVLQSAQISRTFSMAPLETRAAAAEWHQRLVSTSNGRPSVRLEHRLHLAAHPQAASLDPHQLYAVPGVLWMWGRPVRVSLEFWTWSETLSEVLLRPSGLRWPIQTESYARRVVTTLNEVIWSLQVLALSRPVAQPVAPPVAARGTSRRWSPRVLAPRPAVSGVPAAAAS